MLLADCIQMFHFTLVQEAFNMTTIGMNNCDRINMHTEYIEEYVLIFFFFLMQYNTSCLPVIFLSFSKIQNNLQKLLEDGE